MDDQRERERQLQESQSYGQSWWPHPPQQLERDCQHRRLSGRVLVRASTWASTGLPRNLIASGLSSTPIAAPHNDLIIDTWSMPASTNGAPATAYPFFAYSSCT